MWVFCLQACRILASQPGIEPLPTALEGEVLTIGHPGKPQVSILEIQFLLYPKAFYFSISISASHQLLESEDVHLCVWADAALWIRIRILKPEKAEEGLSVRSNTDRPTLLPVHRHTLCPSLQIQPRAYQLPMASFWEKFKSCTFDFDNGEAWSSTGEGDIQSFSGVIGLCCGEGEEAPARK